MGASEVTSEAKGEGGERLCDYDGGFRLSHLTCLGLGR